MAPYSRTEKWALIVSIVNSFLFAVLTNYADVNALLRTHVFWDTLFDGSIAHFYDNFAKANTHNCNLLSRLPLLIWYLPSWIVTKLSGGKSYTGFCYQMWHKLFLAVMFGLCIKSMIVICKHIGQQNTEVGKYCFLLMLVSPGVTLSLFYAGQDEIVYITFFMYALQHYVQGRKKKYHFWAIGSIVCCPLMLMPYMLLTIIEDKKVYSVLAKFLLACIPQWFYAMFFSRCLIYRYTSSDSFGEWYFTRNNINMGYGTFSLLAVSLILIFSAAYLYRPAAGNSEEKIKVFLYFSSILFLALQFLGWDQFYRRFLWMPFAVLLVVNFKNFRNKIYFILILITDMAQSIRVMFDINLLSHGASYITTLTKHILGEIRFRTSPLFSSDKGIEIVILNSLMVSCLLLFCLVINQCDKKLVLEKEWEYVVRGCSLLLPLLLAYSFLRAYVTG